MYPISPVRLQTPKPKHFRYPSGIVTVGDELRSVRIDRGLTQHQVAEMIGVNRNFICEMELGHHTNTIYALHKVFLFLGYIPTTLNIDEKTLKGKLFAYRIKQGYTYNKMASLIGLDKSTIGRFEQGRKAKQESLVKIERYFNNLSS